MKHKYLFVLPLLIALSTGCSFKDIVNPTQEDPVIYIPTEQGVYKARSIYSYKTFALNNFYTISSSPSIGTSNLLIIPVWFTNSDSYISTSKKENVRKDIEKAYFGTASETGWESVASYYKKDSFSNLSLTGVVSDWYSCGKHSSEFYSSSEGGAATAELVRSAVTWYKETYGVLSLKDFDTDKDGYLDGVMLIYGAPNESTLHISAPNMWAYCYWLQDTSLKSTFNPGPNAFFWASYDFMYSGGVTAIEHSGKTYGYGDTSHCLIDSHTYIHEMGHIFGLEDYYDYSKTASPAAGFSMQDENIGGHDPYSRLALGWVTPYVPTETCTFTVKNMESSGELVLIKPDLYTSPFDEYILLELYSNTGLNELDCNYAYNNKTQGPKSVGMRIWHIDARLFSVTESDIQGNIKAGFVTNDPTKGGVIHATSNSVSGSYATNLAGNVNYHIIELIRNNKNAQYNNNSSLSSNDLFYEGDEFSISTYFRQFVNKTKLNNKTAFNWTVKINSLNSEEMNITCTKN